MVATTVGQVFEVRLDPELINRKIFHGYLPVTDATALLTKEGDYLLRLTDYEGRFICVLSVYHNGKVHTICVGRRNKMYFFNDDHQDSRIIPLLNWHQKTKTPLTAKRIILENPIKVASWNLQPSHVVQLTHDIYGCYRMKAYEVVVRIGMQNIRAAALLLTSKQLQTETMKQFMAEARILKELSHTNILKFYGVIITAIPLSMIVELCQINLLLLLQKPKKVRKEYKIHYAFEAAAALNYLTTKGYVHKNVQALNCLIDHKKTLKLADFRYTASDRCPPFVHGKSLESINVGWMAPETMLRHVFSAETDVWAFGVLMWEIYENGATPYYGLTNMQIRAYVITSQSRLHFPKDAPMKVKQLMGRCWLEDPLQRPTFREIEFVLRDIKKNEL